MHDPSLAQPESAQKKSWSRKAGSSDGAWGTGAWTQESSSTPHSAAPVHAPAPSTKPAVTPEGKGLLHALTSNLAKARNGQERHHSGDSLNAPLKAAGRALGLVETEQQTAERRAKAQRGAHLEGIRAAGAASTAHQAGLDHSPGSPIADVTKKEYRDQHRAPKTASVDPDHASMNALFGEKKAKSASVDPDHESMNALFNEKGADSASVGSAPAAASSSRPSKPLHGEALLNDVYERRRLAGGSTTSSAIGVEMVHSGEQAFGLNSSMYGSAAHSMLGQATGINAQELTGHAINTSRLIGGSLAAADPQRQRNAQVSAAVLGVRINSMDKANSEWQDLHKDGVDSSDPQVKENRKKAARAALFKGMKAQAANMRLAGDRMAIHEPVARQYQPEHTVGADATAMGYKAGDTVRKSDRDTGSTLEQAHAGLTSTLSAVSGGTSKAFDTTKYSDVEQHAIASTKATTQKVRDDRDARNAERAKNPEVGDTLGTALGSSAIGRTVHAATGNRLNSYTKDESAAIRDTKAKTFKIHGEAEKRRNDPRRQSVSLWQGIKNFFSSLNPFGSRKLGDYKGFTPENQKRIDVHAKENQDIDDRVKAEHRDGWMGSRYTAEEKSTRAANESAIERITSEQSTGYTEADHAELANQRGKRADIKSVAAGGMTRAENETIAQARRERGAIKEHARDHAAFVSEHDGAVVRPNGRVGGMDSSAAGAKLGEQSTLGGQVAQVIRTGGAQTERAGRIIGGSSQTADAMIREGDRSGAAMTTAMGVGGRTGAIVSNAFVPGSGGAVTTAQTVAGGVVEHLGAGVKSLAQPYAAQQDKVDRHRDLHSGARRETARTQGVDIRPTWATQKESTSVANAALAKAHGSIEAGRAPAPAPSVEDEHA